MINSIFPTEEILAYYKAVDKPDFLLEGLFPERKTTGIKFKQITGASSIPVSASVHSLDTESEIASRQASVQDLDLFMIKRKMQIDEETIIGLNAPRNNQEKEYLMSNVYNDMEVLRNGVLARVERFRADALANGKITIDENNLRLEVDYGVPADQKVKLTGTDKWSDKTSDPIADIMEWLEITPNATRVITSRNVGNTLARHPEIRKAVGKEHGIVTLSDLETLLMDIGITGIVTYDAVYKEEQADGSQITQRYFPKDGWVMIPEGTLGETIYGTTPEEVRLTTNASVEVTMEDYVLGMVYDQSFDPVGTWTKAVTMAVPSFPMANEVFQAKVI